MDNEIIVSGWLEYGERRDDVLKHFIALANSTRSESGCLNYWATPDAENAGRIVVFEHWASLSALEHHVEAPHVAQFMATTAESPSLDRELNRFAVQATTPVGR